MGMPWFWVDAPGWLRGSIRSELTAAQQGVWIGLLALAADCRPRDGTLRFAEGHPMGREYIANLLQFDLALINETIEICCQDKNKDDSRHRIEIWEDGTIELTNFLRTQRLPSHGRGAGGLPASSRTPAPHRDARIIPPHDPNGYRNQGPLGHMVKR